MKNKWDKCKWHKGLYDGTIVLQPPEGVYDFPYCFYYKDLKLLVISEQGKSYDTHGFAKFTVKDKAEAEFICKRIVVFRAA